MTGFVAAPPAPMPPIADAISGDGWWPDLSIAEFQAATRLGAQVAPLRVREALLGAFLYVADGLAAWRAAREAEGAEALADVGAIVVNGEKRATVLWRRAVYATAAAELVETHSDVSATDQGRSDNQERFPTAAEHRRAATVAIRDLTGQSRSRVALL